MQTETIVIYVLFAFLGMTCLVYVMPFLLIGWLIRSEQGWKAKVCVSTVVILGEVAIGSLVLPFWF